MKSFREGCYVLVLANRGSIGRWLSAWLFLSVCTTRALEYELQGVAHDEPRHIDVHFQVCVRDCQWRIRCWHNDGSGLYFDAALLTSNELIRVMEFSTQQWATAVIQSNRVPTGCEEPVASILWLLLSSHCSWPSVSPGMVTPVYDPIAAVLLDQDRRQRAEWEFLETTPRLPKRVVFWNDGRRRIWNSKTRVALEPTPANGPPFTNAVALVHEVSQVDGLVLPKSFEFVHYGRGGDGSGLRVNRHLSARVEMAAARCEHSELVPRPKCRTTIQDQRLLDPKGDGLVTYSATEGDWPDVRRLRSIQRRQRNSEASIGWELAVFCGLALAPLIAVFWRRKRGRAGPRP